MNTNRNFSGNMEMTTSDNSRTFEVRRARTSFHVTETNIDTFTTVNWTRTFRSEHEAMTAVENTVS